MESAYLVVGLREDGTYVLDVFSEPNPTSSHQTAVVQEVSGKDFADAHKKLMRWVSENPRVLRLIRRQGVTHRMRLTPLPFSE